MSEATHEPPKRRGAARWARLSLALLIFGLSMYKGVSYTKREASARANELVAELGVEPTAAPGKVGQQVRVDELEFTVLDVPACSREPVARERVTPEHGQFCTVRLRVVNRGSALATWAAAFSLVAHTTQSPGGALDPSKQGMAAVVGGFGQVDIAPGGSGEVSGVFDIATDDTLRDVEVSYGNEKAVIAF